MTSLKCVAIFLLFIYTLSAQKQKGDLCVTPKGERSTCIPAPSCTPIFVALLIGNDTIKEFAKQFQCGYDTQPLVCCGNAGLPDIFDIYTRGPDPKSTSTKAPLILRDYNSTVLPDRSICGLEKEKDRLLGDQADLGEFPWMAALEYKKKLDGEYVGVRCGGSIINKRFVLTAAHCILSSEFELFNVILGEWRLSTDPDCDNFDLVNRYCADKVENFGIENAFAHEFYAKRDSNNDIALLRLNRDITFTDFIRPICLPPINLPRPEIGVYMTVVGWGATENGSVSDVKMKVNVPLLSNKVCMEKLRGRPISSNHLCAGGEQGKDACQGDSGGPLMRIFEDRINQQAQWYQEGVVSWGLGCGRVGNPAAYTRVSRYVGWIINTMSEE